MVRVKQSKKGWVSVTKLPCGKYMTAAFIEDRVNPIQKISNKKSTANKKAKKMIKKYL